jgi:hypothetical protein
LDKPIYTYFWKAGDELIGKCFFTGLSHEFHLLLAGIKLPFSADEPIFNILKYCIIKKERFLLDKTDL